MTQGVDLHATYLPDDLEAVYTPAELWKRSRLPRDLIRTSIQSGSLPAYNAGRGERPRYFVRWGDFLNWRDTLRVGQ
ncbi:hypothetical protein GO986_00105 [Deinococcus sp. HMF7620]|uniref:DNA-binding protein n=1 Tax=Deinococcus arboris TaxID=2682977 RepID=A0A7C9HP47_9DEIO|nr:hypothetical protein [Deinococcus arboris]MVN85174.1 hypothetical protein [Deinococcus arboris]